MRKEDCIIVGAGPCGLASAIALKEIGIDPQVIEKENIVHTLYRFPTHQTFFSTSDRLEIGGVPFITENRKPKRNQALAYYREVARLKNIRIQKYEEVLDVKRQGDHRLIVQTTKDTYETNYVVIATGYYDHPNYLNIPGEHLPKVSHYFKEAHPFYDMDVAVIGGKNSSVDAAIELVKAEARVTVYYRGSDYSDHIKPWVLPEFQSLVKNGQIEMVFNAHIKEITESTIIYEKDGKVFERKNDFVFAMTGYRPDHRFLQKIGVEIEQETGRPKYNPDTMETNVPGIFIAGVIAAGNNANEIFIENGRFHGERIAKAISKEKDAG
ncbi:YpdA family putative bacillithiol disulfide reductase [Fervidibacillus halotolerans]|uniref:YpdA family putative bacillithiol disulfide reductase n=1 Tax=Fervidibacillus halotolerans TaxID=2980027 RepID=A0A9E8RZC7_9BACI|nr:YpdA family putative bacillithiol disulfide reductase [Fervidibacillus halotolerans]WAA13786.1 YpdA family putative bacillithiol disulfide reductase [Fervidibacillus halotolerans]